MPAASWRLWISRALAAVAAIGAAVALAGLTTGAWTTGTLYGLSTERGNYRTDPNRHLDVEVFPDGRVTAHGDEALQQEYDARDNTAVREALGHAVPGYLDGFANACVVVIGLLAAVGVFRRLPPYLWTVACAVAMGALTAAAVLRFEMLAALAAFAPHLVSDFHVRSQPLADRTTAALVVFLVAAAASAHPLLGERAATG